MPDRRIHRGPHPEDALLFGTAAIASLRQAAADLAWLLDRGYAPKSSLVLVGDRYQLAARQRTGVGRCVCSTQQCRGRQSRRVAAAAVAGQPVWIDGYNVLTTVEAALAGGVVLEGADGAFRDMASMHGSYRKVAETEPAVALVGRTLAGLGPSEARWLVDRPVSNSGRLRQILVDAASRQGWPWTVELVPDPDPVLAGSERIVATADSAILDVCGGWFNLARAVIETHVPGAHVVRLVTVQGGGGADQRD